MAYFFKFVIVFINWIKQFILRIRCSFVIFSQWFADGNCVTPIEHLAKTLLDAARDL